MQFEKLDPLDLVPAWVVDLEARRRELGISQSALSRKLGKSAIWWYNLRRRPVPPDEWDTLKPLIETVLRQARKRVQALVTMQLSRASEAASGGHD